VARESKTYRQIPDTPQRIFWVEIQGDKEEFKFISEELKNDAKIHFKGKLAYPPIAFALPPYEIFFL